MAQADYLKYLTNQNQTNIRHFNKMEGNIAKTGSRWVEFKHKPNHFLFNAKLQIINKTSINHWSEHSYSLK